MLQRNAAFCLVTVDSLSREQLNSRTSTEHFWSGSVSPDLTPGEALEGHKGTSSGDFCRIQERRS